MSFDFFSQCMKTLTETVLRNTDARNTQRRPLWEHTRQSRGTSVQPPKRLLLALRHYRQRSALTTYVAADVRKGRDIKMFHNRHFTKLIMKQINV